MLYITIHHESKRTWKISFAKYIRNILKAAILEKRFIRQITNLLTGKSSILIKHIIEIYFRRLAFINLINFWFVLHNYLYLSWIFGEQYSNIQTIMTQSINSFMAWSITYSKKNEAVELCNKKTQGSIQIMRYSNNWLIPIPVLWQNAR